MIDEYHVPIPDPFELEDYQYPIRAFPYGSEVRRQWLNMWPLAAGIVVHEVVEAKLKRRSRWRAIARAKGLKPSTIRTIAKLRRDHDLP